MRTARQSGLLRLSDRTIQLVLLVSLLLFSLISIYTTKLGLDLVWIEVKGIEQFLLTWGLAIAVGLFMLVLTLLVAVAREGSSILRLALAYFFVATISVFFNFNALYNALAANSIEERNLQEIGSEYLRLREASIQHLRSDLQIDAKRKKLANLEAELKSEEENVLRPGRGPLYEKIKEERDKASFSLQEAEERLGELKTALVSSPLPSVAGDSSSPTYEDLRKSSAASVNAFRTLDAKVRALGYTPSSTYSDMLSRLVNKKSLDYSLVTIVDEARKVISGDRDMENLPRICLAAFIALLIDLPVFFSLVFLTGNRKVRKGEPTKGQVRFKESLW